MKNNGRIICGFAGIGKSTLARNKAGVVDLESISFEKDWYRYAKVAIHMANNGYTVLLSCHQEKDIIIVADYLGNESRVIKCTQ